MKEYICKEDLEYFLKDKYGDEVFTSRDFDCMFKEIQEFNAVTKADICREFVEYVKFCDKTYMKPQIMRHPEYYRGYEAAFRFFEMILAEEEQGE